MGSETIIVKLKDHKRVSSWLLWDDDNPKGLNWTKTGFVINDKYVFVALNASFEAPKDDDWGGFHSGKSGDMNIYSAFRGTEFEGSYITDLLKYRDGEIFTKGDSSSVISCISDDPKMFNENIEILAKELDLFPDNTMVLAFGDDVYKFLISNPLINVTYKNRIIRLPHFSAQYYNNTSDERSYILAVARALKAGGLPFEKVSDNYENKNQ